MPEPSRLSSSRPLTFVSGVFFYLDSISDYVYTLSIGGTMASRKKKDTRVPICRLTAGRQTVKILYDDGSEGQLNVTENLLALPKLTAEEARQVRATFVKWKMESLINANPGLMEALCGKRC